MKPINLQGFLLRFAFALVLVFLSYNPSGYSYFHWLKDSLSSFSPTLALAGIVLIVGWVVYLRASLRSLGFVGLTLALLFVSTILWLFIDWGWLDFANSNAISWVILVLLSLVLGIGISWSHVRRRVTGQVDSDDVDEV